ncbi:MAG: hypothetical protein LBU89_04805 [Fibromonadaceae bacterium]|nr:hypothetical protein [Fibromonadaceae bacterium]
MGAEAIGGVRAAEQMRLQSNYDGWDFNNIWRIDAGKNNGFPYLLKIAL